MKVSCYLYKMKNLLNDYIFPSFLTSVETENLNNLSIIQECNDLRVRSEGVKKSNVHGWHSELFEGNSVHENLNKLYKEVEVFANELLGFHRLRNHSIKNITWWVNINPENTYNIIHSHPKADISIVYYAQTTDGSALQLLRNDGAIHTSLFANNPELLRYTVDPKVGRLYAFPAHLLHHVLSNINKEDRISIAYNVTL